MEKIVIYTDGASKGNPGPGGWGAIVVGGGKAKELGGREAHTTNNRMELMGAIEALRFASSLPSAHTIVHTDSSYVINGITKWVRGWKAKGWKTAQKQDVLNKDLWEELAELAEHFEAIEWKYVGGHVGIAGNERVDEIASDFAEEKKVTLYDGAYDTYEIDVHNIAHDEEKVKMKSSSRTRSRGKAYSYVSEVGGVVKVHKTWSECEARVKGKKARFKKAASPEEEKAIVASFS